MNARWLPMFGAAAAALGGCAVMTIDVDVYKGPLSNHEDVQTEQMAVMAIGAKPLLIKLRDNLEELKRDTPRLPLRGMSWYKEGFIGDGPNGRSHFKDDNAIRVNAILALYADQETRDLSEIFAEGRDALSDSEIAWDIFLDEGRKRSERSWGNLVKGMYRGLRPNGDGKVPPEHPLAQTSADEAESLPESLRDALVQRLIRKVHAGG